MDDEMLSWLRSVTKSSGPPQLSGVHVNIAGGCIEYFVVEWPTKSCAGVVFATHEDHKGLGLPVMNFEEALVKLTIGSFPD